MKIETIPGQGGFQPLDVELARALSGLVGGAGEELLLAIAVTSERTREGHVCVRLEELAERVLALSAGTIGAAQLREALASSRLVGAGDDPNVPTPLVMSQERLYLSRFFQHERVVVEGLGRLASAMPAASTSSHAACLRRWFDFDAAPSQAAVAAATAAERQLLILTGGPGTGKTTTIARVLAFLADLAQGADAGPPSVLLLAPTGKAAARMGEAVAAHRAELARVDAIASALPTSASTIHRALGPTASPARFVHGVARPLLADIVVVDEASMVDIALMRRLLDALAPQARLILIGDEHQLASVEAGAVLADACAGALYQSWSTGHRAALERRFDLKLPGQALDQTSRLSDCVVHLTHSYRFDPDRGVGRLSRAIVEGQPDAALAVLEDKAISEASLVNENDDSSYLDEHVVAGFREFCQAKSPEDQLEALGRFRVLCANRHGPRGVERLNLRVEALLEARGLLPAGAGRAHRYYAGRPLLITKNDAGTRLFNGDMGVVISGESGLSVAFPSDAGLRMIPPARLPAHESVFAMSIHKSQGSEVDSALVVLPDADSPLCTRELLYTAVTRVRQRVVLLGSDAAVRSAISRRVSRASGLAERLAL